MITYSDVLKEIYNNYSDACTIIEKSNIITLELEDVFNIKIGLKHIKDNYITIDKTIYRDDSYKITANSYEVDDVEDIIEIIDNEIDTAAPDLFVS